MVLIAQPYAPCTTNSPIIYAHAPSLSPPVSLTPSISIYTYRYTVYGIYNIYTSQHTHAPPHGHELLRGAGVDADGAVQLLLGHTHLDRHGDALRAWGRVCMCMSVCVCVYVCVCVDIRYYLPAWLPTIVCAQQPVCMHP